MALYPGKFNGQDKLQPGARGNTFVANQPGYRDGADRINRTNMRLNVATHDTLNIKYQLDYRLAALFKYGYAVGFNNMVIPKGRIVAVDPHMDLVDFDMQKQHNVVTLANGGAPVKVRQVGDNYPTFAVQTPTDIIEIAAQGTQSGMPGKESMPLVGFGGYTNKKTYRAFKPDAAFQGPVAQLGTNTIDPNTGKVLDATGKVMDSIRPGNIPIGLIERNEYTRDDDAYNGMMVGPILTDALVELPWFAFKNKAEENPWGSAYGNLAPGMLVKSDENGRVIPSPLNYEEILADMSIAELELERQQVIGQIYSVNTELIPEGAAKWATWALEDRLNFNEFNPDVWAQNNRRGEDAVSRTPYHSDGNYPGYPYDKNYKNSDLHMLASTGRGDVYDQRMNQQYQYENLGIPGLTDGKNVAFRNFAPVKVGEIRKASADQAYVDMYFRTTEVDVYDMMIQLDNQPAVSVQEGILLSYGANQFIRIKYADALQGIICLEITDKALADANIANPIQVKLGFKKRGLSGVPTFMDWDGCIGSLKVLLTK